MKKLKLSILLLFLASLLLFSNKLKAQDRNQNAISFSAFVDTKLLFFGDNKSLPAGTLNYVTKLKLKGYNTSLGYMFLFPEYEFANLSFLKYERYSFNLGYSFDVLIAGFELNTSVGYGFINRGVSSQSFSFELELLYKLKYFNIVLLSQYTQRTDLGILYNDLQWRYSGFLGIEFYILN